MNSEAKSEKISVRIRKLYRELNFTSKRLTSPARIPYEGPKSIRAIIEQIISDGKDNGIELSFLYAYRVVLLFFSKIIQHIKVGNHIMIQGFGDFWSEEKRKDPNAIIVPLKRKLTEEELLIKKKESSFRRNKKAKLKIKLAKLNKYRESKGLKPIKLNEFKTMTKYQGNNKPERVFKPKKVKPINNYTFDILNKDTTLL